MSCHLVLLILKVCKVQSAGYPLDFNISSFDSFSYSTSPSLSNSYVNFYGILSAYPSIVIYSSFPLVIQLNNFSFSLVFHPQTLENYPIKRVNDDSNYYFCCILLSSLNFTPCQANIVKEVLTPSLLHIHNYVFFSALHCPTNKKTTQ